MTDTDFINFLDNYKNCNTTVLGNIDQYNLLCKEVSKNFNVIHLNIRSLSKHYDNLVSLLDSSNVQFDVIILSETWIISDITDFNIDSYDVFYNNSARNRCDGCVVYVKTSLYPICSIIKTAHTNFLRLQLQKNGTQIGILATYNPPSIIVRDFLDDLHCALNSFKKLNLEIFSGDTNIDILKQNVITNDYLNTLSAHGYTQKIDKATRINQDSKTCIDHIFTACGDTDFNDRSFILAEGISDHSSIILNIEFKDCTLETESKSYITKRIRYDKLKQLLLSEEWEDIYNSDNANHCSSKFVMRLTQFIEQSTEIMHIHNEKHKSKLKPWITMGIINSIRTRNKLRFMSLQYPSNITALNNYRTYRNLLNKIIYKTKTHYYNSLITNAQHNTRNIWQAIKKATNVKSSASQIGSIKKNDGFTINDPIKVSNEFNDYFHRIGSELVNKIKSTRVNTNHILAPVKINNKSLFLNPVTENEIFRHINSLKNSSSQTHDLISNKILKMFSPVLIKPITHVTNTILLSGCFPDVFKKATIIPIHKTADKQELGNYRPIALTNSVSKIIEKCIKTRLINFLDKHRIINPQQYGFRSSLSTDDAILKVTNTIYSCIDSHKKCIGIFLDLAKAFDTVSHNILLQKMECMGIRGAALNLFTSYVKERFHRVKINESYSDYIKMECGVPQGTVLGPILFILYINDMLNTKIQGEVVCYADDTVLLFESHSWDSAFKQAKVGLNKIKQWLDSNYLTLNISKTTFVTFAAQLSSIHDTQQIKVCNCPQVSECNCNCTINRSTKVKYLGVYMDQLLKWNDHIDYTNNKIRKTIYKFKQIRNILTWKWLKAVYAAIVESILAYGILAWGAAYKNHINRLQITQKWIIKTMLGKTILYPSDLVFNESKIFNIRELYIQKAVKYIHKNKITSQYEISHSVNTRANVNGHLEVPFKTHTVCQQSISFLGPKLYNEIPSSLKDAKHMSSFCRQFKLWFADNNKEMLRKHLRWL